MELRIIVDTVMSLHQIMKALIPRHGFTVSTNMVLLQGYGKELVYTNPKIGRLHLEPRPGQLGLNNEAVYLEVRPFI